MFDWIFFINLILFYLALAFALIQWSDNLIYIYSMRKVYLLITVAAIQWSFFLGSKSYCVYWYTKTGDEISDTHTVEFPVIWM